ncbi:MAG: hypothetical protein KDA55_08310 [Planctomycetales bacterium]|nr:hypothetical protein [Planctomycetales bacterium]MCA9162696.1 hypothetical protein [Planctomycetales bacterium]MCA9208341.1 hypothetical protein [Planctomycetales bacterium]MCA9223395.1 hypothetical protein [Planctomycetales bacterium]
MKSWTQNRWLVWGSGLAVGLLIGVGMLIGAISATATRPSLEFPLHELRATSTHGGESFAVATGPISDGVEGVFFLDFLTGELNCSVVNPRNGTIGGAFHRNVAADLGAAKDKTPSYLMVTGMVNWQTRTGALKPADCVVYVLDGNTGNWMAYSMPWNRSAANVGGVQASEMGVVGRGTARNLAIRE